MSAMQRSYQRVECRFIYDAYNSVETNGKEMISCRRRHSDWCSSQLCSFALEMKSWRSSSDETLTRTLTAVTSLKVVIRYLFDGKSSPCRVSAGRH